MHKHMLTSILSDLNETSADIKASAIVSTAGLTMAGILPPGLDEDKFGAMSGAMLSVGHRAAKHMKTGKLEQVLIRGDKRDMLITYAGNEAVLAIIMKPNTNQELAAPSIKRAKGKLENLFM